MLEDLELLQRALKRGWISLDQESECRRLASRPGETRSPLQIAVDRGLLTAAQVRSLRAEPSSRIAERKLTAAREPSSRKLVMALAVGGVAVAIGAGALMLAGRGSPSQPPQTRPSPSRPSPGSLQPVPADSGTGIPAAGSGPERTPADNPQLARARELVDLARSLYAEGTRRGSGDMMRRAEAYAKQAREIYATLAEGAEGPLARKLQEEMAILFQLIKLIHDEEKKLAGSLPAPATPTFDEEMAQAYACLDRAKILLRSGQPREALACAEEAARRYAALESTRPDARDMRRQAEELAMVLRQSLGPASGPDPVESPPGPETARPPAPAEEPARSPEDVRAEDVWKQAGAAAQKGDFRGALSAADELLGVLSGTPFVKQHRSQIEAARTEWRKSLEAAARKDIGEKIKESRRLIKDGQYQEALALLEAIGKEYAGTEALEKNGREIERNMQKCMEELEWLKKARISDCEQERGWEERHGARRSISDRNHEGKGALQVEIRRHSVARPDEWPGVYRRVEDVPKDAGGISFWARGTDGPVTISVDVVVGDGDDRAILFASISVGRDWQRYTIDFRALRLRFATPRRVYRGTAFEVSEISRIGFSAPDHTRDARYLVDDIRFFRR